MGNLVVLPDQEDDSGEHRTESSLKEPGFSHSWLELLLLLLFSEVTSSLEEQLHHKCQETYMCADSHKCYFTQSGSHQLFLLFSTNIPSYAMR